MSKQKMLIALQKLDWATVLNSLRITGKIDPAHVRTTSGERLNATETFYVLSSTNKDWLLLLDHLKARIELLEVRVWAGERLDGIYRHYADYENEDMHEVMARMSADDLKEMRSLARIVKEGK